MALLSANATIASTMTGIAVSVQRLPNLAQHMVRPVAIAKPDQRVAKRGFRERGDEVFGRWALRSAARYVVHCCGKRPLEERSRGSVRRPCELFV